MNKKTGIIVALVVLLAAGGGGAWMYHNAQVDKMRAAGIESMKAAVNMADYREEQQQEIEQIFSEGEQKINESSDQETIDKISQETAVEAGKIKTAYELDVEDAVANLRASVSLDDYRDEQKAEVEKILDDTESAIRKTNDSKDIETLSKEAAAQIAEIKTDEQLSAEEEAARQAAAQAAQQAASKKSSKKKNSQGCVGGDASNFY